MLDLVILLTNWLQCNDVYNLQCQENEEVVVRFGLVTDSHYADIDTSGSRYYRDSIAKLTEAVNLFNSQGVDFIVETGDFKDQGIYQQFNGPTYHVLGNHDMDAISKTQFLTNITNTGIASDRSYYSVDIKGVHFVFLDANYNADGSDYDHGNFNWTYAIIPQTELDWLQQNLAEANGPTVVFIHQLLDGVGDVYVKNAETVRSILEASGKVTAVFQGHHHSGSYNLINGIHYYTLKGMIEGPEPESNSYATVEIFSDKIIVTGYRNAISKEMIYALIR
jgi:alkaline phosphatase